MYNMCPYLLKWLFRSIRSGVCGGAADAATSARDAAALQPAHDAEDVPAIVRFSHFKHNKIFFRRC